MYTALYRTYRPETFAEVLGQESIVKILKNQLSTGTVSHAYIFCGTRGTGKTTTARILAKAVNCLSDGEKPCGTCANCIAIKEGSFPDVIEIDAASNNGVENIRELRDSVKYPPAIGGKKVYIIDEVHMLSTGAFNALLKTLEEPPEHVMFILATTEPQKLPATILSRCMRLDFRRVSQKVIAEAMVNICKDRGVEISQDAVRLLANCADGSVRDGLSILDRVLAGGDKNIDRDKVLEYVGTTGEDFFIDLTELVLLKKSAQALVFLNEVLEEGKDVKQIMKDWVSHYRSLLITKFVKDAEDMLNMSSENLARVKEQSNQITIDEIDFAVRRLSKTINDARWSTHPRILLELAIVAISSGGAYEEKVDRPVAKQTQYIPTPQPVSNTPEVKVAQKPTEELKPKEEPKVKTVVASAEADIIWRSIFEDGDGAAGSFNLIRSGTELINFDNEQFTVAANSDFTRKYTEQKRADLEKMMSNKMGKNMRMNCILKEEVNIQQGTVKDETEDLAKEAEALLGISINIE
jgi:DNA polymerase-3 subunit gamma/tau